MSRGALLLFLVLFLLPAPSWAQAPTTLSQPSGLPSNGISALAWDGEALWVGTIAGLGRWEPGRAMSVELPLEEHGVLALHSQDKVLWVGTAAGIARYEAGAWQTWQRGDAGLRSAWATSFAAQQGALYVGTYGGGVQRWSGQQWESLGTGGPTQVTALAGDEARLWAGTPRGLWRWDGTSWQREPLPESESSDIAALLVTRESVWVAAGETLFQKARAGADAPWQTQHFESPIRALAEHPGGLVIGTERGLLTLGESFLLPSLPPGATISALLFADGMLFAGTMGQGLWHTAEIEPLPAPSLPPVVLVHGLGDSDHLPESNFRFMAQRLQQDGYPVTLAPSDGSLPLLDNVALLRRTIARARAESGQPQVILIAHSMGGLVARAFLASGSDEVATLVTLGSPHAGTRLVYDFLVADLATSHAASTRDLLPEHAALVAPFGEPGHIPQLHIGGDYLPRVGLLEGFPPNDGRVSAASAVAAPGEVRVLPLLHGWSFEVLARALPTLLWPDSVYVNTIRPWLQQFAEEKSVTPDRPTLPDAGFTRRPLLHRTLLPGESLTLAATLGEEPTSWLLEGAGLQMELVAPDGTRYAHDRMVRDEQVVHLVTSDPTLLSVDLWNSTEAGLWQATVRNVSTAPINGALALIVPDAPGLDISLDTPWVAPGASVPVTVRGEAGYSLSAILGEASVVLAERSPGVYEGTLPAPRRPGYHALRVVGEQVERWAVVGVRSERWRVAEAEVKGDALRLVVEGEGRLALGIRLLRGEELVATRLLGPFRFPLPGPHTITQPLPTEGEALRMEWQLFDASRALVPVTPILSLGK